jgi:hydrogenase-4 component F
MVILLIGIILLITMLTAVISKDIKVTSMVNIAGMLINLVLAAFIIHEVYARKTLSYADNMIYIDSFSLIQIFIISAVSLIASIYSYKYINEELKEGVITLKRAKMFYALFSLFVASMFFMCVINNIMLIWIGLEATTLSTAFLISLNRTKLSLEASWKYIIICSVGIGIGLIGIILFIYSLGTIANDTQLNMLSWTYFYSHSHQLSANIVKIAFAFIFVGMGTKAGLAPMHTWLSDAHSEAPSPISSMMSGILLNLAMYAIVRFYLIAKHVPGLHRLHYFFIVFGLLSLAVSAFSILKQSNYKRQLAFSSVENIGIISLGFGIGGPIAIFGAVLHSVIHAFAKTLLFLVSGNILSVYKTKRVDKISNLFKVMPVNSVFLIIGMLAIVGAPPFASFFSEYKIMVGSINNGYYAAGIIYAICLLLVFAGFLNIFLRMIFKKEEEVEYKVSSKDRENILPIYMSFTFIVCVSIYFGGYLTTIINRAVSIICA